MGLDMTWGLIVPLITRDIAEVGNFFFAAVVGKFTLHPNAEVFGRLS